MCIVLEKKINNGIVTLFLLTARHRQSSNVKNVGRLKDQKFQNYKILVDLASTYD